MKTNDAVIRVQSAYPKIYLSCHRHHQNAKTSEHGLSQRDATILAHLTSDKFTLQSELAVHLGISKSTLSEAITWLETCGYIEREASKTDSRSSELKLTQSGVDAMSSSSVLEYNRLAEVLETLAPEQKSKAVLGLEILAEAALKLRKSKHSSEEK